MHPSREPASTDDEPWTITHDFMYQLGGAERVTATVAGEVLTDAPVVCLAGSLDVARQLGIGDRMTTSSMLPEGWVTERNHRAMATALSPLLSWGKPLPGNVFASSYAFSHHLRATGRMVVYCHSPLRQAWSGTDQYATVLPAPHRLLFRGATAAVRRLDLQAARRVDQLISSGPVVSDRIRRYYEREPDLELPPPVDTDVFRPLGSRGDYYLWAGRIVEPYKRVTLLIETFAQNGRRLIIAGDGRDRARLEASAPPNVSFVGALGTEELVRLMSGARAFLFPSADDFGIAPVEAMACGTPVIAFRGGGARHTIVEERTGLFFDQPEVSALQRAISHHAAMTWDRGDLRAHAQSFSASSFVARLSAFLEFEVALAAARPSARAAPGTPGASSPWKPLAWRGQTDRRPSAR